MKRLNLPNPVRICGWVAVTLLLLALMGPQAASAQPLAAPPVPTPLQPTGTIPTDQPEYQWSESAGAISYHLMVYWYGAARYVVNLDVNASVCSAGVCKYTATTILRNGTHGFKVRAQVGTTKSAYSAMNRFTVKVALPAPTLTGPSGDLGGVQPTYKWAPVTGATRYYLWVYSITGKKSILTRTLTAKSVCNATECSFLHPVSLAQASYRFYVRAGSTYTWGPYSPPMAFTIASFVMLGWNDLGMHCYNQDFSNLAVLPPYNNLWAQVIQRGNPPKIVTTNIKVEYSFPQNTFSVKNPVKKSNFWDFAQALFNLPNPLPLNIGLTGLGLSGQMTPSSDHFTAEGIPLTEFNDNTPTLRSPYQLASLVAKQVDTGVVVARLTVVAPVSTEMHCDYCHKDGMQKSVATGKVETNILALHDLNNQANYATYLAAYPALLAKTPLMDHQPVLCASCHASNALGTPIVGQVKNLSNAMHSLHDGKVPDTITGCYNCHPGPSTKCLRDVMNQTEGMTCTNCHGHMEMIAANTNPWLNEPRCDECHDVPQNDPLYRHSTGHGGVYCEGCHDSTHAIAKSREPNDAIKFIQLQGHSGTLSKCTVCHTVQPKGEIHGGGD
jgi:hypothetical protein